MVEQFNQNLLSQIKTYVMKIHNSRSLKDYIKTVLRNIGIKTLEMKLKGKKNILTLLSPTSFSKLYVTSKSHTQLLNERSNLTNEYHITLVAM